MGRRPKPVFPRVTADDAPRLAAELFVECLESEGVEYIFGIPGEETLDLNEALDRSERITFVPTRHEQGAAFIADAYGRLTGDGGFLMNVQELETAKRLGLPFVVLVWRDGGYGLIEMHQRRKFGRVAGTRFENPDLVGLARSFGVDGVRVDRAGDFRPIVDKALDSRGPVVIDIPIDYAENNKLGVDLWQLAPEALA